jgi:hypothetical protein
MMSGGGESARILGRAVEEIKVRSIIMNETILIQKIQI